MMTGKKLIDAGFAPAKWFGKAIETANAEGMSDVQAFDMARDMEKAHKESQKGFRLRDSALRWEANIDEDGHGNFAKVKRTMDELMRLPTVVGGTVMPDGCPAGPIGHIPVGGVAAVSNAIHPAMHSADICCSVMATVFSEGDRAKIMDIAQDTTHFGPGGRGVDFLLPEGMEEAIMSNTFLSDAKTLNMAKTHMGTQGDGNHFLFVGSMENNGKPALATHHGSRGFGARLYSEGMKVAEKFREKLGKHIPKNSGWIPFDTEEGRDYWEALQIVRAWTKANHEAIHDAIASACGYAKSDRFWNPHNFVFEKDGIFYHAKGATPLEDAMMGEETDGRRLIPLNMAQPILVVKGDATEGNLGFAPHGAGRNFSRSQHKRFHEDRTDEEVFREETKGIDARFFSGNIDISELPSAYKDADSVQKQIQKYGLGKIVDRILPYGSIMAGDCKRK